MIQVHPAKEREYHEAIYHSDRWQTKRWFALYTRSRHEKLVDRELRKKGVETFLPVRKITRQWSDRRKLITEPLFKGYLFVHFPLKNRYDVLNTTGAVCFVGPKHSDPLEVPEVQLATVRKLVEEEVSLDPFPYLKVGERVYVRSGRFKGAEGFIVRKGRHCRLVVSLDMLMQSVSMQIDSSLVEPI